MAVEFWLNVAPSDNLQQDCYDGYHQENMNNSAGIVTAKKANSPDNYQNYRDYI